MTGDRETSTLLSCRPRSHTTVFHQLQSEVMAGENQQLNESVVIRSLRRFRDRYFTNSRTVFKDDSKPVEDTVEEPQPGFLDSLPVSRRTLLFFSYPTVRKVTLG